MKNTKIKIPLHHIGIILTFLFSCFDAWAAVPSISSISPVSGAPGNTVTISGSGFGASKGSSAVKFGATTAATTSWSNTSIKATAPAGTGRVNVTVTTAGGTSAAKTFTYKPILSAITPNAGPAGSSVTLSGTSFGATAGTVVFDSTSAAVTSWTPTSITANVPAGSGMVNVKVTTSASLVSNTLTFTYRVPPAITTISPTSGNPGNAITISGTNFGTSAGTVNFGATTAAITSWSSTQVKAQVPAGQDVANVSIKSSANLVSNSLAFTYKPVLTGIQPNRGSQGDVITLNGTSFGSVPGLVSFGTTSVVPNPAEWTASNIRVTVPAGTGTAQVSVKTSGNLVSGTQAFQYLVPVSSLTGFKVLANNDLGMHCVDKDFSVFSILPPYNVINGQVVGKDATGKPVLLYGEQVELRYSPVTYQGGTNSYSIGKSNFWSYSAALFGANLSPGQGLKGLYMPGDDATKTSFGWNEGLGLFSAEGLPILPKDDNGASNPYPLMKVSAYDRKTQALLASVDTVVPVSDETTCGNCHETGKVAATGDSITWSNDPNLDRQARINILKLHDAKHPATTSLESSQPVLCAGCHYSPALDLAGTGPVGNQVGKSWMSATMHDFHAGKVTSLNSKPLFDEAAPVASLVNAGNPNGIPPADQQSCYQCHPGSNTKCLRGAMTETVTCQNCHGDMKAVGAQTPMRNYGPIDNRVADLNRKAWSDEPRCQSCHTGDAINHLKPGDLLSSGHLLSNALATDGIRLTKSFDTADAAASPLLANNKRFAENDGKLFRHSKGHGGIACEGCHGSTHAIWPGDDAHPKDDIASKQLQTTHAGTVSECSTCHTTASLAANTQSGPHGMHVVNDSRFWKEAHKDMAKAENQKGGGTCAACHGADHLGTALSRVPEKRAFMVESINRVVEPGQPVACDLCHSVSKSFGQ